jgi:hypothetical protein
VPRVLYAVWCDVDPAVEKEWEAWMRRVHVPDVVRAGSFLGARMHSLKEGGIAKRVTIYDARDPDSLRAYIEGPAKRLRDDYSRHFGDKSKLTRMVLEESFSA